MAKTRLIRVLSRVKNEGKVYTRNVGASPEVHVMHDNSVVKYWLQGNGKLAVDDDVTG